MKENHLKLILLLRFLTDLLLVVNILVLIALPWLLTVLFANPELLTQLSPGAGVIQSGAYLPSAERTDMPASSYTFYLLFFYLTGAATAWLLLEGHLILRRLENGQPFAVGQARSFRRMSVSCGLLLFCFGVKILAYNTIMTMICTGLFLILVLVTQILAEIFHQAYLVKIENELTI